MNSRAIVLDLETAAIRDLRKCGAHRLAQDPDTTVTCWSYTFLKYSPRNGWRYELAEPVTYKDARTCARFNRSIDVSTLLIAHNAAFERAMWQHILTPRFGWPPCPPLSQWRDTMAMANYFGLPAGLGDAGEALGLPIVKDKEARKLMLQMARPRMNQPGRPVTWWHKDDPDRLQRLTDYCAQDVMAEAELFMALPQLPKREQALWVMDQQMNERGIGLDTELHANMLSVAEEQSRKLDEEMNRLTNAQVPNTRAVAKLLNHVRFLGFDADSLARPILEKALAGKLGFVPKNVRVLLQLRMDASRSSVAKLNSMAQYKGAHDDVMRGLLQHYGAWRTGRWAGRGPQPQNFPRPTPGLDADFGVQLLLSDDPSRALEVLGSHDALTTLSGCLRGCLVAPGAPDNVLVCADYAQIEARVCAWLANQVDLLETFTVGGDVYVHTAKKLGSTDRQFGKLMALSSQYQTGGPKLKTTAEDQYGILLSDEAAQDAIDDWREANTDIVELWWDLNKAAIAAVREPGRWFDGSPNCVDAKHIEFRGERGNVYMRLPSGRMLCYRQAKIEINRFGRDAVTFMGLSPYTHRWESQSSYGGMWCNHATQGTARDFMADAMLDLRPGSGNKNRASYSGQMLVTPLLSVHDELVCMAKRGLTDRALNHLIEVMERQRDWAPSVPIAVAGYVADRFRKG